MISSTDSNQNFPFADGITDYLVPNNSNFSKNYQDLEDNSFIIDSLLDYSNYYNPNPKMNFDSLQLENGNLKKIKDLEKSNELNKLEGKINSSKEEKYRKDKQYIEAIQLKIKENIYLKRPFKEKKSLGRKKKSNGDLGEHNKYSDDNILRKCKHAILDSVLNFINNKIKTQYSNESEMNLKKKRLLKLKQNQSVKSKVNYNKEFLKKTLKVIFSEDISSKYSKHSPSHNKNLIESLINEKDEIKSAIFNKIFSLTFLDCLEHFRGSNLFNELQGMNQVNKYIKEAKIDKNDEEYCKIFQYFINNFENIIFEKKERKRIRKK